MSKDYFTVDELIEITRIAYFLSVVAPNEMYRMSYKKLEEGSRDLTRLITEELNVEKINVNE